MRRKPFAWGLMIPPVFGLVIAAGVVHNQSSRQAMITEELRQAKQEVSRLTKLLPKGETVPEQQADDCKDEHHAH